MIRWIAASAIALLLLLALAPPALSHRHRPHPSASPSLSPIPTPSASPALSQTAAPTTFDDEFSGTSVGAAWRTDYHIPASALVGYQPPTESGGYLHLPLTYAGGWIGSSVDTKLSFSQLYGTFAARMWFPEGAGLWPAFWGYDGGPEIDGMEVCANPLGANGGNDASLLHQTIHFSSSSQQGFPTRHADLANGWHVYGWTWTPSSIAFSLDGVRTATYSGPTPSVPMPMIVDLAAGGSWCGAPATSDAGVEALVDWVRVSR